VLKAGNLSVLRAYLRDQKAEDATRIFLLVALPPFPMCVVATAYAGPDISAGHCVEPAASCIGVADARGSISSDSPQPIRKEDRSDIGWRVRG